MRSFLFKDLFLGLLNDLFPAVFFCKRGVGVFLQILFANNGSYGLFLRCGSLDFENADHARGDKQPHQHDLCHNNCGAQAKCNQLGIGYGQEVDGEHYRECYACMHYGALSLAAADEYKCNGNELAQQNCTKRNNRCSEIDRGIGKNNKIGDLACLKHDNVALNGGFEQLKHAGCRIEVSYLQAGAADECFGNGEAKCKYVAINDLNVDQAKVVCRYGIKSIQKLGCFLKGNKATCGNVALCNGIGNSTAQSLNICNRGKRDAALLTKTQEGGQLHCTARIVKVGYGNRLHSNLCGAKDVFDLFLGGCCGNSGNCLGAELVKESLVFGTKGAGHHAIVAVILKCCDFAILESCKHQFCFYCSNQFLNQLIEVIGQCFGVSQLVNLIDGILNNTVCNCTVIVGDHAVELANYKFYVFVVFGQHLLNQRNTAVGLGGLLETDEYIIVGAGLQTAEQELVLALCDRGPCIGGKVCYVAVKGDGNLVKTCHVGVCKENLDFGIGCGTNGGHVITKNRSRRSCHGAQGHILCSNSEHRGGVNVAVGGKVANVPFNDLVAYGHGNNYVELGFVIELDRITGINDGGTANVKGDDNLFACGDLLYGIDGDGVLIDDPLSPESSLSVFAVEIPNVTNAVTVFVDILLAATVGCAPVTVKGVTLSCGNNDRSAGDGKGCIKLNTGNCGGVTFGSIFLTAQGYVVDLNLPRRGQGDALCVERAIEVVAAGSRCKTNVGGCSVTVCVGKGPTLKGVACANGIGNKGHLIELEAAVVANQIVFVCNQIG